ncbi:MAG: hypothetical protein R2940_13255 [Syntrophotaleaceae bacterium]
MEKLLNVIKDFRGPAEDKIREKGRKMIERTFEDQKSYGLKLQDKFEELTNADILTTALPFRADIPKNYRNRLTQYREKVREIIFGIAVELQNQKFKGLDNDIKEAGLSKYQERRYIKVRDAQKELYASYDAIRESLNYITDFNNKILKKINEATGAKKTDLLLLNAIIVYELTDAIIDLLEDFQLRGKDTLQSINDQVLEELRGQEAHDEDLQKRASHGNGHVEKGVQRSIKERREIRQIVIKKWKKIWKQVTALEANILNAKGHLETLKLIRDNAKGQINILEVIGITQIVESNIRNFQEICAVTNIELAPLTKEDVYGLIGRVESHD